MKKISILPVVVLLLVSCSSTKKLKEFSENKLIFGSGGGFTGQSIEYALDYDGIIEKTSNRTSETIQIDSVPPEKSKELYKQFLAFNLDTLTYASPGNMSYFVGYKNDSIKKKIIWGGIGEPPTEAKLIYNSLIQLLK